MTVPVTTGLRQSETVITQTVTTPAVTPAAPAHDPGSHVPFSPWYTVVDGLMAGVPVPLPPPDTFTKSHISASLTELRETGDAASRVATREYAKATGGLSFDIEPADAAVFVGWAIRGERRDYAPDREPLLLRFGGYTVELRAEGYGTVRFPVSVSMGEVMPFKSTLPRSSGDRRARAVGRTRTGRRPVQQLRASADRDLRQRVGLLTLPPFTDRSGVPEVSAAADDPLLGIRSQLAMSESLYPAYS